MDTYTTKPASGDTGTLLLCGSKVIGAFNDGHEEEAELAAELLNEAMGMVYVTTGEEAWEDE